MRNPLRRKRNRYQKARDTLRAMLPERRDLKRIKSRLVSKFEARAGADEHEIPEHERGFAGLHWMTAGLFVAAGAEAAFGQRRGDYRADDAIRWAPLVAAPLAGAAQAARAIWPGPATRNIAFVVNSLALAVGAAGLASSVRSTLSDHDYDLEEQPTLSDRMPSLAPLAFGAVGLLGLLLDSQEEQAAIALPAPHREPGRAGRVKRVRIRV